MNLATKHGLLLRRLALSGTVALVSAAYVLSQAGRLPTVPATSSDKAETAPASHVRLGARQIVEVKDGEFRGTKYDARFGHVRVKVRFASGKIVAIQTEEYPDHSPTSVRINVDALPRLEQEAITVQSADVDAVTGATLTSKAWARSVRSAIRAAARS